MSDKKPRTPTELLAEVEQDPLSRSAYYPPASGSMRWPDPHLLTEMAQVRATLELTEVLRELLAAVQELQPSTRTPLPVTLMMAGQYEGAS